jgi:hypothetical protein
MVKVLQYSLHNIFISKSKCEWKNNLSGILCFDFKKQHNYNETQLHGHARFPNDTTIIQFVHFFDF